MRAEFSLSRDGSCFETKKTTLRDPPREPETDSRLAKLILPGTKFFLPSAFWSYMEVSILG